MHEPAFNVPTIDLRVVVCPHCDLLQRLPVRAPDEAARCPRCDKGLWRRREDSREHTLALALATAILYVVANTVPTIVFSAATAFGERPHDYEYRRNGRGGT